MGIAVFAGALVIVAESADAEKATVAVASNFLEAANELKLQFEQSHEHEITLSSGSTGQLFAKIAHGAPFDAFLAADQERPSLLVYRAMATEDSQFTYAVGLLTLYSPSATRIQGADALSGPFRTLSIANPRTAPYGAAAKEVLEALGLGAVLENRTAHAQNVTSAFMVVKSGAADLGFVALSAVLSKRNDMPGSRWDPPTDLYTPLKQDAVLLERGRNNQAAIEFLAFVASPGTGETIAAFGYLQEVP